MGNGNELERVVITGMHRSGTTFLGEMVRSSLPATMLLHEPLNLRYGCKGVPCWYPYLSEVPDDKEAHLKSLVDNVMRLKCDYIKTTGSEKNLIEKLGRALGLATGPKSYYLSRVQRLLGYDRLVIKDPFMLMMIPYLTALPGTKVILLVRHPAALYFSMRRMNWHFDFTHLKKQEKLQRLVDFGKMDFDIGGTSQEVGLLWKILHDILVREGVLDNERVLVIRHEDLCMEPVRTMDSVCSFLGEKLSNQAEQHILSSTQAETVHAKSGVLHDMTRNAKALATSWHARAHEADIAHMEQIVGERLYSFYPGWKSL